MISYFRSGPGEWWRFRSDTRYATHTSDYGPEKMIFLVDARGRRQVPTPYPPPPTKTYFIYYDCDHRLCTDVCLPPFFLPRLPTSASLPSPPPTLPVPLERGHLLSSLRFLLCGCVYASWSTRWFRNNDPSFRGWVRSTLKSRWLVFFFFFFIYCRWFARWNFEKFRKSGEDRGDRRGSSFVFFCYTIDRTVELELLSCDRNINGKLYDASVSESSCTYHSWRAHALSRAGGYIRPDYAEGGPINIRRRPLFVRTRSLRSVANFSRDGASPPFRDSSICPIFRCLGRGPIRVDARARLRRFEVDCGYSGWNKKSLIISEGWFSWNH